MLNLALVLLVDRLHDQLHQHRRLLTQFLQIDYCA